ncbi:MAG: hypothetical protein LUD03_05600 [Firmicutes bacterium]|nr:hypothetical protein [Bacillota bacterium]
MKKNGIISISAAAVMLISSFAPAARAQFDAYTDDDGMTLGYYTEAADAGEREETEALYANRPKNERRFEYLTRGLTAVPSEDGTLVSWRFLGTDSEDLTYNLYCNGEKLNSEPIELTTNFFHKDAPANAVYTLKEVENGVENGTEVETTAWSDSYIGFKVEERDGYNIDDGAVADLDGDGEYEILLRRIPSMDVETRTTYPLIEAYKTDGTLMWTIDIGPNEINEHDINIMAYDFDGDGRSEVVLRSFEGTTDGAGNTIGDTNSDGITDYSLDSENLAIFKDRQYIVSTPEFLSVYDGETGGEIARTDLLPEKEPLSEWSYQYTDTGRLTKRASHYLFGLAYLDGVTPSIVMVRGAWDNVRAAAWHMEDGELTVDWVHETENVENVDSIWGACNHNLAVLDVDFDGKDEIISGPMAIDDDGSEMYAVKAYDNDGTAQKLLHGDAFDAAKMDPDYDGYLVWACHETSNLLANIELHDARTGQVTEGYSKNKDTGRSRAADIDPNYSGFELWGSTGTVPQNVNGEKITDDAWNNITYRGTDGTISDGTSIPMNFKVYWDGDLLSELLDNVTVSKWNWEDKTVDEIFTADGCASNSGTKAVPVAAADLFGDWREEIVFKTEDETEIRIYSTAIPTQYRITTLMHDSYYRACVATQSNHYNQPSNLSYYLGAETTKIPVFEGYVIDPDGNKLTNPDLTGDHAAYKLGVGVTGWLGALSVKLLIDSPNAYVGNEMVQIDEDNDAVVPVIENDRTLVPVRFIAESLGMNVGYNYDTREVTLTGNGYDVKMTLDDTEVTVNGTTMTLDVPATSVEGRTLVPVRAIAEMTGKTVEWDDENRLIYIGTFQFYNRANAEAYAEALRNGDADAVIPTNASGGAGFMQTADGAAATAEPTAEKLSDYTDDSGVTWGIYVDEDYESYNVGDNPGWEGTNQAYLDTIAVASGNGGKVMQFGTTAKGNRNAIYTLPSAMTGKTRIELDWNNGSITGGSSYGELRFADSSNNVFFALKTMAGQEMQYSADGSIAQGNLETDWTNVGSGFNAEAAYHIVIEADFDAKTCTATISNGSKSAAISSTFTNASNFDAVEVLAVRIDKNWTWTTWIDNLKIGMR